MLHTALKNKEKKTHLTLCLQQIAEQFLVTSSENHNSKLTVAHLTDLPKATGKVLPFLTPQNNMKYLWSIRILEKHMPTACTPTLYSHHTYTADFSEV